MGSEKEAKAYVRKIYHETLRISVIDRLEGYLDMNTPSRVPTPPAAVIDDDDDDNARRASPVEPQIGMWVDQCKRLFLWYYDIYLVLPHISNAYPRIRLNWNVNQSKTVRTLVKCPLSQVETK